MSVPLELRADLVDLEPYRSPQRPARYRMNTNESPFPPPRALVEEALAELKQTAFHRYPDHDVRALTEAVAEQNSWPADGVWMANGSNEVFLQLFLAFGGPGRIVLTFEPTYSLHTLIARITGTATAANPRPAGFAVDRAAVEGALDEVGPDIVMFCSPNNPTGLVEDVSAIEAALARPDLLVVVDEAYIEFAPSGASVQPLLGDHPNLVVTKTFSKAWSLAGARLGYLVAHPWLIERMAKVRLPYHLSAPSQLLGLAAIRHADAALGLVAQIAEERDRIVAALGELGLVTYPSAANFVLFEVEQPRAIWDALLERDVLIRDYSANPLLARCLRVSATKPEETDAFLDALREVLR